MKSKALYLVLAALALTACTGLWLKTHDSSADQTARPDPW